MITVFSQDEASKASEELNQFPESQANAIALDFSFDFIHAAHRGHALDTTKAFNQDQLEKLQIELTQGRRLLEAKKALTRKGEFTAWRNSLSATLSEARKYMALVSTFGDWSIEKLIVIASATNIYVLCQKKYTEVVEQLRSASVVTKEYVQGLVKEFRAKSVAEKKKTKKMEGVSADGVLEQHIDEGGGFYYTLKNVNLSENIGSQLQTELETKSIGQVLAQAIKPSTADAEAKRLRQELKEAVDEMRDRHIEMERQIIQKDQRISELEEILSVSQQTAVQRDLNNVETWEQVIEVVECDRSTLLNTVKGWSLEQRQSLSGLLAQYLESNPDGLNQIDWVPDKLRDAALGHLSFAVEKIIGPDNLVDEPKLERIPGCLFVSLRDFGTKQERWLFRSVDVGQFPVFGREEFKIEQF